PRVPSSTAPSEGRRDVRRGSPAEVPESSSQSPGPPLQAVPELAGEHSRLLTGSPAAFGGEDLRASCELACQRRVLPCEVSELVACAVGDGSGLIAFAFDPSQSLLGHLLQRRSVGHCFPVFSPGLCEFAPDLRKFAAG